MNIYCFLIPFILTLDFLYVSDTTGIKESCCAPYNRSILILPGKYTLITNPPTGVMVWSQYPTAFQFYLYPNNHSFTYDAPNIMLFTSISVTASLCKID